jgi:hypothetical protein
LSAHRLLLSAVALVAALSLTSVTAQEAEWSIDRWAWSGPAGEVIEVENVFGDLRIRGAATDQVEVTAVLQHVVGDPRRLRVAIDESGPALAVSVVVERDPTVAAPASETAEMRRRRVDLVVMVPATAELRAWTDGGLLEVKGVDADVAAQTESGRILLKVGGGARVRSERGDVEVVFANANWDQAPEIVTGTGEALIWLPRMASVAASIATRGEISTDYSLSIARDPNEERLKLAEARIDGGEFPLHIQSTRGRVRLLRAN